MAARKTMAKPEPVLLPFDLGRALAGAPLITRAGRVASDFRAISRPHNLDYVFEARIGNGWCCFTEFGTYWINHPDPNDLFLSGEQA
jgi:hypothetical protein